MKPELLRFAYSIIVFCLPLDLLAQGAQKVLPRARVTVRVVDETNNPVSGVDVRLVYSGATRASEIVDVSGLTDDAGLFAGEGYCDGGYGVTIRKGGYYESGLPAPQLVDIQDGRWIPWDPVVTTVLRRIGDPVPLCAKRVQTDVPLLDQPCGYDLEIGDWVAPNGKGVKSDLTFKIHREHKGFFDFSADAEVTFAQERDGIVRMSAPEIGRYSRLRWEREAPEERYGATHRIHTAGFPPESGRSFERSFDPDDQYRGYFVQVRTEERDGKIVAANYGRITGDIGIEPRDSKTCSVSFTYYFNPVSLDRNLEWDTSRNLLRSLSREETPRDP